VKQYLPHVRRGLASIAGNVGNLLFTLGRNKLLAIYLGPIGVGWIGLANNLVELGAVVSGAGVSDGLLRELARHRQSHSRRDIISTGFGMLLISLLVVVPAGTWAFLVLAKPGGMVLLNVAGFAFALVAAGFWRFVGGIYIGLGWSRVMFRTLVLAGFLNMVLSGAMLWLGWHNYLGYVVLTYGLIVVIGSIGLLREVRWYFSPGAIVRMPAWRPFLVIMVPILIALPLDTGILLFVRSVASAHLGEIGLGLIQPGLVFVILISSLFNAFAGMTTSRWDQSAEPAFSRQAVALLAAAVALPLAGAAFLTATAPMWGFVIHLFFSRAFEPGAAAVPWFLMGEALHMGSLLLFSTFLSRGLGIYTVVPRVACMTALVVMLRAGVAVSILSIGQAYCFGFVIYFAVTLVAWIGVQVVFLRRDRLATAPGPLRDG
jgi:O-antigen/teichoic acid export membrane protein